MTISARQQDILKHLRDKGGTLSSAQLTELFDVSVQTIRKDLNDLNDMGLVKRIHGGITLPIQSRNLSFHNRQIINLMAKQQIAHRVVQDIPEGASLFLGIGTTLQKVAEAMLDHPGATVITNNLNAALILCQNERISTYLAGGQVRAFDQDITGEETTEFFRRFKVNYGIFGLGGIDETGNLLDFSSDESNISRAILENCQAAYLLADKQKFMRSAPVKTAHLREIDRFYTDALPDELIPVCANYDVTFIETEKA